MRTTRQGIMSAIMLLVAASAFARTYIAERGDTWESVARKWGLYTDELKARNSIFPTLYAGLEIDLPENASQNPLSTWEIARLERADRELATGIELLEAGKFRQAMSSLNMAGAARGRSTASLLFLQGRAKDGLADYEEAFDYYTRSSAKLSDGDLTLTEEQTNTLRERMAAVGKLAAERRLRREAQEAKRREEERKAEEARRNRLAAKRRAEAEADKKRESRRQKASSSGGWGFPVWGGGWGMPMPSFQPQFAPDWNSALMNWNSTPATWTAPAIDWNSVPTDIGTYAPAQPDPPSLDSGNPREQITFSDHTCTLCGGKGTIPDNGGTTFGLSSTKYCSDCGKTVDLSHRHIQCPSCGGRGMVRKRD